MFRKSTIRRYNMATKETVEALADQMKNSSISGPVKFHFHFPEEVWILILEMLTQDSDRTNCCLALPYLDRILTRSKPVWLFEHILPHIKSRLTLNELLNCRGACVQWREDIDNLFQDYQRENYNKQIIGRGYFFISSEQMSMFLQNFNDSIGNPIVGRGLLIRIPRADPPYQNRMFELLSKVGNHLRVLHLTDLGMGVAAHHWYPFVRQALICTPNLKYLALCGKDDFDLIAMNDIDRYLMEVGGAMAENLLPFLPFLESMTFSLVNFPAIMQNMIMLPYINQLTSLTIRMENWNPSFAIGLASLQSLELQGVDSGVQLESLMNRPFIGPVERLKLKLNISGGGVGVISLLRLFEHLPLLEKVFLELGDGCGLEDGEENSDFGHLVNSTVKVVQILHNIPVPYRFLKSLKALQKLEIMLRFNGNGNEPMEEARPGWILKAATLLDSSGVGELFRVLPNLNGADIYRVVEGQRSLVFRFPI